MTDDELDYMLTAHWPAMTRKVATGAADDWVRGFVMSIARQAKRPRWRPTPKQAAMMRRLVAEFRQSSDDEFNPIEE